MDIDQEIIERNGYIRDIRDYELEKQKSGRKAKENASKKEK